MARTLEDFKDFNAFYSDEHIHYYGDVNVGVAINTGDALLVPVVHRALDLGPEDVSRRLASLVMAALRRELREADMAGGTFTITDLSGAGALSIQPLINRDQAAILAMGLDEGPPRRLLLTLTFDHRLADGLLATRFLQQLKDALEAEESGTFSSTSMRRCTAHRRWPAAGA